MPLEGQLSGGGAVVRQAQSLVEQADMIGL